VEVGVVEGRHRKDEVPTEHTEDADAKQGSENRAVTGAATRRVIKNRRND
jgi:hypothetical protein